MEKDEILSGISKLPMYELPGAIPVNDRWVGRDGGANYDISKLQNDDGLYALLVCVSGVSRERKRFIGDVSNALESEPASVRDVPGDKKRAQLASWHIRSRLF